MVRTWQEPAFGTTRHYLKINGIKIHWYLVRWSREGEEHRVKIKRAQNNRSPFINLTHSLISSKEFSMYLLQACLLTIPGSHIPFPTPSGSLLVFKVHVQRFKKMFYIKAIVALLPIIIPQNTPTREYWMIYRGPCFLALLWFMIWLLPYPLPPSFVSKLGWWHTGRTEKQRQLADERGWGRGGG